MKICSKCGNESPDDSAVCPNCGTDLTESFGGPPLCPMSAPPVYGQGYGSQPPKKSSSLWIWLIVAVAGTCCGGILILAAILFPVFSQAKLAARRTIALSNTRQAALATLMYASDFDHVFPYVQKTASAVEVLQPYTKTRAIFKSPFQGGKIEFNLNLGGVNSTTLKTPYDIPMWMESLPDSTMSVAVAFVDGHAKQIHPQELPDILNAAAKHYDRPKDSKPLPPNYMVSQFGG